MRRIALIGLCAGLLGVALLAWIWPRGRVERAVERAASVGEVADAAALEMLEPPVDRSVVEVERERSEGEWTICVNDAVDVPASGASVSVLEFGALMSELDERGVGFDTREGLRMRGERAVKATADTTGCARFERITHGSLVEARLGQSWAHLIVVELPADRCIRLRLGPDRELRVRVCDPNGNPISGVPVALRRLAGSQPSSWKWTDTDLISGIATFFHFQRRLEQGDGWHAMLAFPVRGESAVPVDANTPLAPPVPLVLEGAGRVRIRVRGAGGFVPELEGVELALAAFESPARGDPLWSEGPWSQPILDENAEALVPWIGLGLHVEAKLVREDEVLGRAFVAGPTRDGEEVSCEIEWREPPRRHLTGRFVLDDGSAWPPCEVRALATVFPSPKRWTPPSSLQLDAGGRFRLQLSADLTEGGSCKYTFTSAHPERRGYVIAVVALPREIPREGLDLGDIVLDHGELLAEGRVIDEAGRPVAGASFELVAKSIALGNEMWPRVTTAGSAQTSSGGAFEIYMAQGESLSLDELRLSTRADGYAPDERRSIRRGERGLEIVLTRSGVLAGSLSLADGLETADIELFLVGKERRYVQLGDDAKFEIYDLLPGTYALEANVRATGSTSRPETERVDDLLVRSGETLRDPRVQDWRIESPFSALRVRVLDDNGVPLRGAIANVAGFFGRRSLPSGDDGVCRVLAESVPVDIDVSAFGFLRHRAAAVDGDREIRLSPGPRTRLIAGVAPLGSNPRYMLGLNLLRVDAHGNASSMAWGNECPIEKRFFDDHGALDLRMPALGDYECHFFVTVIGDDHVGRGAPVEMSPAPRFTVLASDDEQVFELHVPQSAIDAAVARALR